MVSPSSGWTQGILSNNSTTLATLTIPVTGTWLISFNIVITSTTVSVGILTLSNADFSNIGLSSDQTSFGGCFTGTNTLTIQGSLVVNGISGVVNASTTFGSGNGVTCVYSSSFFQATRIG